MGRKMEVQETMHKDFNFCQAILRPGQSGAHGTCHACHSRDTPLLMEVYLKEVFVTLLGIFGTPRSHSAFPL